MWLLNRASAHPRARVVLVLCVKNDTAPSPIQLYRSQKTLCHKRRGGWSRFLINLLIFFVTSNSVKLAGKVAILS